MKYKIPYYKQETLYTCGPATFRMVLASLGMRMSEKKVAQVLKHTRDRFMTNASFPQAAESLGFSYRVIRNGTFAQISQALKEGYRVIVNYYHEGEEEGHFAVVRSLTSKAIGLLDPWSGPNVVYTLPHFRRVWYSGFENDKRWFFAVKK